MFFRYDAVRGVKGALYVGSPETVTKKIIDLRKKVCITRFMFYASVGTKNHDDVLRSVELLGTKIAPFVREEIAVWEAAGQPTD